MGHDQVREGLGPTDPTPPDPGVVGACQCQPLRDGRRSAAPDTCTCLPACTYAYTHAAASAAEMLPPLAGGWAGTRAERSPYRTPHICDMLTPASATPAGTWACTLAVGVPRRSMA